MIINRWPLPWYSTLSVDILSSMVGSIYSLQFHYTFISNSIQLANYSLSLLYDEKLMIFVTVYFTRRGVPIINDLRFKIVCHMDGIKYRSDIYKMSHMLAQWTHRGFFPIGRHVKTQHVWMRHKMIHTNQTNTNTILWQIRWLIWTFFLIVFAWLIKVFWCVYKYSYCMRWWK